MDYAPVSAGKRRFESDWPKIGTFEHNCLKGLAHRYCITGVSATRSAAATELPCPCEGRGILRKKTNPDPITTERNGKNRPLAIPPPLQEQLPGVWLRFG